MKIDPQRDSDIQKAVYEAGNDVGYRGYSVSRRAAFPFMRSLTNFILKFFDDYIGKGTKNRVSDLERHTIFNLGKKHPNISPEVINTLCIKKFKDMRNEFEFQQKDAEEIQKIISSLKGEPAETALDNLLIELSGLSSIEKLSLRDIQGEDNILKNHSKNPNPTRFTHIKANLEYLKRIGSPLIPLKYSSNFTDDILEKLPAANKEIVKGLATFFGKHKYSVSSSLIGNVFGPLCFPDTNRIAARNFQHIVDSHQKLFQ